LLGTDCRNIQKENQMSVERGIQFLTKALLDWFREHGRHDLPWQENPTPYRVWVSEIMLQQTQVSTVIGYYQRFINKFSSVSLLAEAGPDEVLGLWSGLGYYARARHLHRCAQIVCEKYQGNFPENIEELAKLPGIGRSTAGAILSFSMQVRAPILDGNVKRVLTRYHAIEGIPSESATNKQLWELSAQHTPQENYAEYNQAIMDLGATLCTRHKPACTRCPAAAHCQAYATSRTHQFPYSKVSKPRPQKSTQMLLIKNPEGNILLEKRPPAGIWGGLWSFPECEPEEDLTSWCHRHLNADILNSTSLPPFNHAFSHYELTINPTILTVQTRLSAIIMEPDSKFWYKMTDPLPGGVATPVAKLLTQLKR